MWQTVAGRATLLALLLWWGGEAGNTVDCIENTGGGCVGGDCFAWRGPTRCDVGRCFCTQGTCSGGDGVCTDMPYARPGNSSEPTIYRIRNARWPKYYIDIDMSGTVDFEKNCNGDDCKFTLSMPAHAGGQEALRAPIFLIASVRWPKSTMMVIESSDNGKSSYQAAVLNVDGAMGGLGGDMSIADVGMVLTQAPASSPEGDVPVMFSSAQYPNQYLYIPKVALAVGMNKNDPGAGGYWFFEPRLPEELRAGLLRYSGPRCTYQCGTVASTRETATVNAAAAGAVSLPLLATGALGLAAVSFAQ